MPNRFRRKPPEVDAVLWDSTNRDEINTFVGPKRSERITELDAGTLEFALIDGSFVLAPGQWLLRSDSGVLWALTAGEMARTYEPLPPTEDQ